MISEADLKKVAHLARLQIDDAELAKYQQQFKAILEYFEQISKVDTKSVEPMVTPTDIHQHLRPDVAEKWSGAEAALANAPERTGNLFKVPPVV